MRKKILFFITTFSFANAKEIIIQPQQQVVERVERIKNKYESNNLRRIINIASKSKGQYMKILYKPNVVYEVFGQPFMSTAIVFDKNENIKTFALSDSGWSAITNENQIYLKPPIIDIEIDGEPLLPPESTLFVTTTGRDYYFKLKVTGGKEYNPVIKFIYPENELKFYENISLKNKEIEDKKLELSSNNLENLNFNYVWDKKYEWSPINIVDNGRKTVIYFRKDKDIPIIFIKKDGELEKIDFVVKRGNNENQFIINQIFSEAVIQYGRKKIIIKRKG